MAVVGEHQQSNMWWGKNRAFCGMTSSIAIALIVLVTLQLHEASRYAHSQQSGLNSVNLNQFFLDPLFIQD